MKSTGTGRLLPPLTAAVIVTSFLILADARRATAQQSVTSVTLSGRVLDATGAALSGASVTATNLETNQWQTATSDEEGRYRFAYLTVGTYQLAARAQGFAAHDRRVTLTIGQALDVPLRLTVADVAEEVNVTTDVPVVETVRTQVAETIRPGEVDGLPFNGRNYLDLALLAPGVTRANTGSNQRFAETSAVPGQGLSVAVALQELL